MNYADTIDPSSFVVLKNLPFYHHLSTATLAKSHGKKWYCDLLIMIIITKNTLLGKI